MSIRVDRDAVGARHVRHPRVESPGRASQNELGTGDRSGPGRKSVRPSALGRRRSAVQSRPWAPYHTSGHRRPKHSEESVDPFDELGWASSMPSGSGPSADFGSVHRLVGSRYQAGGIVGCGDRASDAYR